ncbi:MAG: tetratricopeptide repeat protein [Bdellovibrionaceae bacterium]|nr:tetratricopeptide repeat protein [Bdellovibrio sp.]
MKLAFLFHCVFMYLICSGCKSIPPVNKETGDLHSQIAIAHIEKGNYPLALKELLIAQDINPNDATIQSNLAHVYFMRQRYDLAEDHYKRAIAMQPAFTDAKNNLARVYIETSQYRQAENLLKIVLADLTYVDFSRAYANYGILEFNRKNFPRALSYFKKSLENDRENCITHVYLGRAYLELKENLLAASQLEKAVGFCNPLEIEDAHYYSAIALFRNGQKDRAIFRFEELIKLYPNSKFLDRAQKMLEVLKKGAL